ncbi:hypothetical protein PY092_19575 [Muricauda sp. 334s03]|uniref:DUF3010 family protein n=1 Tax=Flagellimonas yonaguniensis TaxID=3031325 RepID=A0ABT5Y4U3_9FLAO|nr:hypothetical protein [[Muricauda] yonaguniensis]MDF0718364.1 hypothetical protein [[Muricauda] yonaguniensis]
MLNILGIHCSVLNGFGKLAVVILTDENEIVTNIFRSPSVFSFRENTGEILNWHKDNVLSLISLYKIDAIVVKKTESNSFNGRPKKSDFFKLYLEGVMLSIAGSNGMKNRHLVKNSITALLQNNEVYDKTLSELEEIFKIELDAEYSAADRAPITESLLAVLAYKNFLTQ